MHVALEDLHLEKIFVVYPGRDQYPLHPRVETLPLIALSNTLLG